MSREMGGRPRRVGAWAGKSVERRVGAWAKQSGVDDANDVVWRSTGGLEERAHSLMLLTGATRRG